MLTCFIVFIVVVFAEFYLKISNFHSSIDTHTHLKHFRSCFSSGDTGSNFFFKFLVVWNIFVSCHGFHWNWLDRQAHTHTHKIRLIEFNQKKNNMTRESSENIENFFNDSHETFFLFVNQYYLFEYFNDDRKNENSLSVKFSFFFFGSKNSRFHIIIVLLYHSSIF